MSLLWSLYVNRNTHAYAHFLKWRVFFHLLVHLFPSSIPRFLCSTENISCLNHGNLRSYPVKLLRIIYTQWNIFSACFLSSSLPPQSSTCLFLEHPGDRDPLGVFGNRFQRCFDGAVCLVEVVVDNAEVKVVTISCLDFSTLIARPLQFFILWRKTDSRAVNHRTSALTDFSLFAASWVIHLLYVHMVVLWAIPTISVLVTTPASAADWFMALSTSNSGAWRNTM